MLVESLKNTASHEESITVYIFQSRFIKSLFSPETMFMTARKQNTNMLNTNDMCACTKSVIHTKPLILHHL